MEILHVGQPDFDRPLAFPAAEGVHHGLSTEAKL